MEQQLEQGRRLAKAGPGFGEKSAETEQSISRPVSQCVLNVLVFYFAL